MAATNSRVGIQHLTVVPTNFEPSLEDAESEDSSVETSNRETAEQ